MDLSSWLDWIKSLHGKEIDFSLERTAQVAEELGLLNPSCPVVTVAGTNGKGSCVAGIEAVMLAAGYQVGAFTTPFLFRYNEQVRLQGVPVGDEVLCDAFECVAKARGSLTLTLFEFGTLAAMVIFKKAKLDLWILEVGMGGRWDAVNVIDADVAVVSNIAIDHVAWLGNTRDAISFEKAGIFRPNKPAVYGDLEPPDPLVHYANILGTPLFFQGKQFGFVEKDKSWDWWSEKTRLTGLPLPQLMLQNMSTVLMSVELLQSKLPVPSIAIQQALQKVALPGRIQVVPGEEVTHILDVSHNPDAVALLARYLRKSSGAEKTHAVFSMLADKDVAETILAIQDVIDYWHVAPLTTERAASGMMLTHAFHEAKIEKVSFYKTIPDALVMARQQENSAKKRVVVFGSFHTVAEANV